MHELHTTCKQTNARTITIRWTSQKRKAVTQNMPCSRQPWFQRIEDLHDAHEPEQQRNNEAPLSKSWRHQSERVLPPQHSQMIHQLFGRYACACASKFGRDLLNKVEKKRLPEGAVKPEARHTGHKQSEGKQSERSGKLV